MSPPKRDDEVPTFRGRSVEDEPDTRAPDSQQVLKADAARRDATDRETPANSSPGVGPMGAGQPADAGPTSGRKRISAHVPQSRGRIFTIDESAAGA